MFKIAIDGPAGSGKTTWIREHATPGVSAHISRDRIRFSMVKEDEEYFANKESIIELVKKLTA